MFLFLLLVLLSILSTHLPIRSNICNGNTKWIYVGMLSCFFVSCMKKNNQENFCKLHTVVTDVMYNSWGLYVSSDKHTHTLFQLHMLIMTSLASRWEKHTRLAGMFGKGWNNTGLPHTSRTAGVINMRVGSRTAVESKRWVSAFWSPKKCLWSLNQAINLNPSPTPQPWVCPRDLRHSSNLTSTGSCVCGRAITKALRRAW